MLLIGERIGAFPAGVGYFGEKVTIISHRRARFQAEQALLSCSISSRLLFLRSGIGFVFSFLSSKKFLCSHRSLVLSYQNHNTYVSF